MRTIKFRGKRADNGEWVYGMPIKTHIGTFIVTEENPHICSEYGYMEIDEYAKVIPDAIGQFTGLTDCNGKEIYEGDIVKYDDTPYNAYASPYSGEVVFYCGSWRIKTKGYGVEWVYPYLFRDDFANRKTELLGNKFDNPELIPN